MQAKEAAKQEEEAKWAAIPEWKRKLMAEKQKKAAEERAQEEVERSAMLETIPEWKRNPFLKKQKQWQPDMKPNNFKRAATQ